MRRILALGGIIVLLSITGCPRDGGEAQTKQNPVKNTVIQDRIDAVGADYERKKSDAVYKDYLDREIQKSISVK